MFKETEALQLRRIEMTARQVGTRILAETTPLQASYWRCGGPVAFAERLMGDYLPIHEGDAWGDGWKSAWFHLRGTAPAAWAGHTVLAWLDINTEGLLFLPDGTPWEGISAGSVFDTTAWRATRPFIPLFAPCRGGESVEFWLEGACMGHPGTESYAEPLASLNGLTEAGFPHGVVKRLRLARRDDEAWALYLDFEVLRSLLGGLAAGPRRAKVLHALMEACAHLGRCAGDFAGARGCLAGVLAQPAHASDIRVAAVGHAHLDTAWLWPLHDGRRKCARTFANQLRLLERYDDYVFGASSAQHYAWMEAYYPSLFTQMQARIAEGRWEVLGGMWVEADCNLPSGESLIRQFLYGKAYFQRAFGRDVETLWLPDVFGYSGNLPQIMRICGAQAFATQKLSWGEYTKFPHQSFRWRGIDGSEVVTHFPPENNYCSNLEPSELIAGQNRFAQADVLDEMLSLFGYGDGGGGPIDLHLERARRCANLEGCPPVRPGRADDFFARLLAQRDALPCWEGELYVENHRGTLTTQSFIKAANRRMEQTLQTLDWLWSCAPRAAYPQSELNALWQRLLTLQFHDIIPGSSIAQVYAEARADFDDMFGKCRALCNDFAANNAPVVEDSLLIANSLPVPFHGVVTLPPAFHVQALHAACGYPVSLQCEGEETVALLTLPPQSFTVYYAVKDPAPAPTPLGEPGVLENALIRYSFADDGALVSIYDKEVRREVLPAGARANILTLYHDQAPEWDAWNVEDYYEQEQIAEARLERLTPLASGSVRQGMSLELTVGQSLITQRLYLRADSKRLDCATEVDWRETHAMLRVAFPLDVHCDSAACDIQYGYLRRPTHRNTIHDAAHFEVVAHQYADLSDGGYGVALLNDGKYGHKVYGNTLDLALLRSPLFPDPGADQGRQCFTYALLPHLGGLTESTVQAEAASLNRPPTLWAGRGLPMLSVPVRLNAQHATLEVLKRPQAGEGWIVRVVERAGQAGVGTLCFPAPMRVTPTDALERALGEAGAPVIKYNVSLRGFEIQTYRIEGAEGDLELD